MSVLERASFEDASHWMTRLAFALILKFFELEARFPRGSSEFPAAAVV